MTARFSSISRYRRVPDVATIDRAGRATTARDLRPLPDQPGTFRHTVSEADRLDHLAFKYFDQPRDWWRVLDANPAFVDPEALLGNDRFSQVLLPLTWAGADPRWTELEVALRGIPGVTSAHAGTDTEPIPTVTVTDGAVTFTIPTALAGDLDATVAAQMLTVPLAAAIGGNIALTNPRFAALAPGAWRIVDLDSGGIWTFRLDTATNVIAVQPGTLRYAWRMEVEFNRSWLGPGTLRAAALALGFGPGPEAEIQRIGKPIIIPPRTA